MSELSTLSELARFVGQSDLAAKDSGVREAAMGALSRGIATGTSKRKVTELLGMVMALSARSRRIGLPRVDVDVDVFSPHGARAVRLVFGPNEARS